MKSLRLLSPAKLNFYLEVVNKRSDGFHNIVTLFQRINLCDEVTLQKIPENKIIIECDHPDVPLNEDNLVYKAAQLIKKRKKISSGVAIHIKKRIPIAAGMAGGSSNAAMTILGLNTLWKLKLSEKELLKYAKTIGSDVAFFLYDTAWGLGTGRGDEIVPIDLKASCWQTIVTPPVHILAKDAYKGLKLRVTKGSLKASKTLKKGDKYLKKPGVTNLLTNNNHNVNILIHYLRENDIYQARERLLNDLEPVVIKICPQLIRLKERLKRLKSLAVMVSGSGPSVFGLMNDQQTAQKAKSALQKQYSQVFVARTL